MEKTNKRALMICYKFPPDMSVGSLRSRKYAQYLDAYGWGCEVITATRGRNQKTPFPDSVNVTSIYAPEISGILNFLVKGRFSLHRQIKRLMQKIRPRPDDQKTSPSVTVGGLGIATKIQRWLLLPDPQFLWVLTALAAALYKGRRCDVIYSSVWPVSCHMLGLLVHKLTGKPWVADYRDEWTLNSQWAPPTRFHRWLGEKLDAACVRNARFVVNTTEIRTQNFIDKYGQDLDKYVTIHNGYDEQDIAPYRKLLPDSDVLTITSIGSLYGGRDARLLLNILADAIQNGDINKDKIRLNLIGGQNETLQCQVDHLGIGECVQIIPRIPQPQAFEYLAKSHIALLIGSDMERYAMTTKLYEYAGMGLKILALAPEGPVKDFVLRGGGLCAMYDDRQQVEQALRQIVDEFNAGLLVGKSPPRQTYERRNLTRQQAALFDRCIELTGN